MKRTALLSGMAVVVVGGLALAVMLPPTSGISQATNEFEFYPPPSFDEGKASTGTGEQVRAELESLRACLRGPERKAAKSESAAQGWEREVLLEMQGCLRASERRSSDLEVLEMQAGLLEAERNAEKQNLAELVQLQAGMTPAEQQAQDDYLSLKLGPDVDVSGVERVPGADKNQPYRTCEKTLEMRANTKSPGDKGNRAYRDIALYLSSTNVIATSDCTCAAKIIPHATIVIFEDKLREELGVEVLEPKHSRDLFNEYSRQKKVVDAMCGEF